ncbi:MAG: type VI secretion system tip protein VgrG [Deltaproteobacteria bacterium]|nr:type VI secretion system tip protein VgrG [Nannocystaceae bacterium]
MDGNQTLTAEAVAMLGADGMRPAVRSRFECSASPRSWSIRHAVVREALARPYRITLSVVTAELDTDVDELVGATCSVLFDRVTQVRTFHGVVLRVQVRGVVTIRGGGEALAVELEVGPALATMAQRINCRIFQDMTVPEIVRDVLLGLQVPPGEAPEGLRAYQRDLQDDGLSPVDYLPARDYCVQYEESDLDFVMRLLHDEGIVFVFEQDQGEAEIVRLVDREELLPVLALAGGALLPVVTGGGEGRDAITRLFIDRTAGATKLVTHHHDWLMPDSPVRHAGSATRIGGVADGGREVYRPSDRRVREISIDGKVAMSHDDAQRRVAIGLEQMSGDDLVGRGSSNVCALGAGTVFEIDRPGGTDRMVALEVVHEITVDGDTLDVLGSYENHFVCVPSSRFRAASPAVPRPRVHGPQTATVTGPEHEDIHTDAFGRIKILMHWDREGEGRGRERRADPSSSVWVRVAQSWAGAGWGAMFLPRVGMEVLVEFLAGNPDRPVVSGCLYNGRHPPPYPLPEERTKSTLRTWSTPHTGGYNELRFEDAAELEEVYLRAQRDYNELVQRNHTTHVKVDQSHAVGHDRARSVGRHESIVVEGNRSIVVEGTQGQGFSGQTVKISNDYVVDVAKTILVKAPVEILFQCEGSSIRMTPNEIVLQAGGGAKIVLNANVLVESNDLSRALFDKDIEIRASTGSTIKLDAAARTTSNDKAELLLTDDAKISSNGDGHALLHSDKITIDTGEASVVLDQKKIDVDADEIQAKAETKLGLEGGGGRIGLQSGKAQVN